MTTASRTPSSTCNRRLFRLALGYKRYLAFIGIAPLLGAVAVIFQMASLARIIDGAFLGQLDLRALTQPFLWLAGAILLRAAGDGLNELCAREIAAQVKEKLRNLLLRSLLHRGPLFTQGEKTGELAACTIEGVEKLDAWYSKFLPHTVGLAIVPPVLAVFVLWIDWPSGLVLILTGLLIPIFMALLGMMAKQKTQQQWTALSRLSGHFLDVLQGLPTLQLLGRSSVQSANIKRVSEQFRNVTMRVLSVAFLSGLVLELAASISTALVAVEIGIRLIEGLINFQTGLLVLLLAPEFYLPFRLLGASHHAGMEGVAAAERIFQLLDSEPVSGGGERACGRMGVSAYRRDVAAAERILQLLHNGDAGLSDEASGVSDDRAKSESATPIHRHADTPIRPVGGVLLHVRFENVSYHYPGSLQPAVSDLTFDLLPDRLHLLVGHSGAGKSTIAKLLLKFMEPLAGDVLVNGRSLAEIPVELWSRQVAFVSQQPHFFEGSVFENLRITCPSASLEEVEAAAGLAEADDFIRKLPRGYDTPLSEAARRFSGGERQRLAIARAFLKNSPLVLLDEPASHLDSATAAKLRSALMRLVRGRTTLVIAHHGFVLTEADTVFELAQGRLRRSISRPACAGKRTCSSSEYSEVIV